MPSSSSSAVKAAKKAWKAAKADPSATPESVKAAKEAYAAAKVVEESEAKERAIAAVRAGKRPRTRSMGSFDDADPTPEASAAGTGAAGASGSGGDDTVATAKAAWKAAKASGADAAAVKAAKREYKAAKAGAEAASRGDAASAPASAATAPAKLAPGEKSGKRSRVEAAGIGAVPVAAGAGAESAAAAPAGPEFASFAATPFTASVKTTLTAAGFTAPTPVQAKAWPVVLTGSDLVAIAKTGSGKTLGFLLPAFHKLAASGSAGGVGGGGPPAPQVLVVAPTRELAQQIAAECGKFGRSFACMCLYGGTPVHAMKAALRKTRPTVVVATPGRLVDMLEQRALTLGRASYVVLDEADRMLDMGFEPQMRKIFAVLPPQDDRQTLLFSATWPKAIRKLAATFLKPAGTTNGTVEIFVDGGADAELEANKSVSQRFIDANDMAKDGELYKVLVQLAESGKEYRAVVFANTKSRVDKLTRVFWDEGFGVCCVHGGKAQKDRDSALRQFVEGKCPIMVATDVAARGLDIKGVTHVVNYDMARDVESYCHRIGRTGRAGELGESITFWNGDYDKPCTPALVKIAKDANQPVPAWLEKFASVKASKQWKVTDAVLR